MIPNRTYVGITLAVAMLVPSACVVEPEANDLPSAPTSEEPAESESGTEATEALHDIDLLLAQFQDETGSMLWLSPTTEGDLPEVVITINGNHAPIVHPDIVEEQGALVAYLVASGDDELPQALLPFATEEMRIELAGNRARIESLRESNRQLRATIEADNEAAAGTLPPAVASTCNNADRIAARNAYGAAYSSGSGSSGSRTCGQAMNWHTATGSRFWCDPSWGGDCEPLPTGSCEVDSCTTVRGRTTAWRARLQTTPSTASSFQHYGKRYRFGYKNCSDTHTATFQRRRGTGGWITTSVSPGAMQIRVGGGAVPWTVASVASAGLGYTTWHEDHSWDSASEAPMNRMRMLSPTYGFMCGDIIQRFRTDDYSPSWCNGGEELCTDIPCSGFGGCFE